MGGVPLPAAAPIAASLTVLVWTSTNERNTSKKTKCNRAREKPPFTGYLSDKRMNANKNTLKSTGYLTGYRFFKLLILCWYK